MRAWENKMGASFLSRQDEPILVIGQNVFTRRQLIEELRCANFAAAARLNSALGHFSPKGLKELAARIDSADLMGLEGVGVTTVYVWLCVLEHVGKDPIRWIDVDVTVPTAYE